MYIYIYIYTYIYIYIYIYIPQAADCNHCDCNHKLTCFKTCANIYSSFLDSLNKHKVKVWGSPTDGGASEVGWGGSSLAEFSEPS